MRGFQKCWFGQGIPSESNAKPLFGIHSFHKVTLFTMTCDVSEPVLMNVSASATPQNTTAKSSLRSKYNGFRGDGGLSETLLKSRVCEVNTMVSGPPMYLNSCSFYCCFTVVIYVVFRACAM